MDKKQSAISRQQNGSRFTVDSLQIGTPSFTVNHEL